MPAQRRLCVARCGEVFVELRGVLNLNNIEPGATELKLPN